MEKGDLQKIKSLAEGFFENGNYESACDEYRKIRALGEEDPKIYLRLGDISRKLGEISNAVEEYKNASKAYASMGFIVKAIAVCKLILNLDPTKLDVEHTLAVLSARRSSRGRGVVSDSLAGGVTVKVQGEEEVKAPEEERGDKEEEIYDDFIEDYIEIIEFIGEEHLSTAKTEGGDMGLKKTPLFSDMSTEELINIIGRLQIHEFSFGDYIFKRGDEGNSIYVITSGAAEEVRYTKYGEEVRLPTMMEGEFFGEYGYFSGLPRKSEVRAATELELLEITRGVMDSLAVEYPHINKVLMDFYKERVLDKTLAVSKVFRHLDAEDRQELLARVRSRRVPGGSDIILEGDSGDTMFIIISGTAEVWSGEAGSERRSIVKLEENDYFGEVSVLFDKKRVSNVLALTPVDLIEIRKDDLVGVFSKYPVVKKILEGVAKKHLEASGV